MDLISIIVPVYNTGKFIEQCLNSILQQSYSNLEIILIDDGSTDNSGKICDNYAKKDKRIKVIHQPNKGVSFARNLGITVSKGKYIGFVDSDDSINKEMFMRLYSNMMLYNADISMCGYCNILEKNDLDENIERKILSKDELIKEIFFYDNIRGYLYNKLYKSEICKRAKIPEELNICEDLYYLCEIITNEMKIIYDSSKLYYLRESEGSLTRTIDNLFDADGTLKYINIFSDIKKKFLNGVPFGTDMLTIHEGRMIIGVMQDMYENNQKDKKRIKYLKKEFFNRINVILYSKAFSKKQKASMLLSFFSPGLKKWLKRIKIRHSRK